MSQKKQKSHVVPPLYGCYLLRSIPKPNSFYVGSTPDPVRRQKQHNQIYKGGARRTKVESKSPWEMILYVYGFPSRNAALGFETAWQHAYQTRHIPSTLRVLKRKGPARLHQHIGNVKLLLRAPFFKNMELKVHCFRREVYQEWCKDKCNVRVSDAVHVTYDDETQTDELVNIDRLMEFKNKLARYDATVMERYKEKIESGTLDCALCEDQIDYLTEDKFPLISVCPHCKGVSHLHCLAQVFREESKELDYTQSVKQIPDTSLIPKKGVCPHCERVLIWSTVVRYSTRAKSEFGLQVDVAKEAGNDPVLDEDLPLTQIESQI